MRMLSGGRQSDIALYILVTLACIVGYHFVVHGVVSAEADGRIVTAREVRIVDADGTLRARLGVDIPDAVVDGKVVKRGAEASGLMLYDATGQERGGYVVLEPASNIVLTLDSRRRQVALFAADPEGGSTLRIWNGDDAVELRADQAGARFTAVRDGRLTWQEPAAEIPAEACEAYRDALENMGGERVHSACAGRFSEDRCAVCLDKNRE